MRQQSFYDQNSFLQQQLLSPRVQQAYTKANGFFESLFQQQELNFPAQQLYLCAFKNEQIIEVWATDATTYKLIKTYAFTATSGNPGPKQREGDLQIPEGFYKVIAFNPESKFHLSFKINYPNAIDSVRNKQEAHLGSDIYIHGGTQTRGCIPVGDDNIETLYWLTLLHFVQNPAVAVHIFPCRMEDDTMEELYNRYPAYSSFWKSMQPMYHFFQSHKILAAVTGCDAEGNYQLAIPCN